MTAAAINFVHANLSQLTRELAEYRKTGWLHGGCLRDLANLVPATVSSGAALPIACELVVMAALVNYSATDSALKTAQTLIEEQRDWQKKDAETIRVLREQLREVK